MVSPTEPQTDQIFYTRFYKRQRTYGVAERQQNGQWILFDRELWETNWYPIKDGPAGELREVFRQYWMALGGEVTVDVDSLSCCNGRNVSLEAHVILS